MWRTPEGERVLRGSEAAVFALGLRDLLSELVRDREEHSTGVAAFDRLTYGQRLDALRHGVAALLAEHIPVPAHTASVEAAIYAVFRQVRAVIDQEMDLDPLGVDPDLSTARRAVRQACWDFDAAVDIPWVGTEEDEAWDFCVDALTDRVLWDRDWELEEDLVDHAPEVAMVNRRLLRITETYFTDVPRDLRDDECKRAIEQLQTLLSGGEDALAQ